MEPINNSVSSSPSVKTIPLWLVTTLFIWKYVYWKGQVSAFELFSSCSPQVYQTPDCKESPTGISQHWRKVTRNTLGRYDSLLTLIWVVSNAIGSKFKKKVVQCSPSEIKAVMIKPNFAFEHSNQTYFSSESKSKFKRYRDPKRTRSFMSENTNSKTIFPECWKAEDRFQTTQQKDFKWKARTPAVSPHLTIRVENDLGTKASTMVFGINDAQKTHYVLGEEPPSKGFISTQRKVFTSIF